jgi:UDP-N-acetylglucosamine transferase subunit ALG13
MFRSKTCDHERLFGANFGKLIIFLCKCTAMFLLIGHIAELSLCSLISSWLVSKNSALTGSGSIFETLRLGKPLIVVVNEDLMDNHQSVLAEELAERKHLFCTRPQTLGETIRAMDPETHLPCVPGDAKPVVTLVNKFVGFPVD